MEDPGAGARAREHHRGAVSQLSDGGAAALLVDCGDICGAPEVRLLASEQGAKGVDFAVGLVDPLEAVSASLEGRMCEVKGSSSEERPMGMEEDKAGSLPFAPPAEHGSLRTCHAASGGLSDKTLHVPSSEAGCSKDVGCIYGTLDKAAEESPCERVGNGTGDWGGMAEGKTVTEDLDMASKKANHCYEGLSDSMKPGSEQWSCGVNDSGTIADTNNEPQQNDLVPAEICKPLHADSVPSVSGSIGVSVDGKTVQFHQKSDNPVASHVADGGSRSINCLGDPAGCMVDTVGMATQGNPCEQNSLAGGSVLNGGVDVKTSLNDEEVHCNGPHDDNRCLQDLVKFGIEQLQYGVAATCLKKNADPNLEKYGLSPKVVAEDSLVMHENSVPSVSGGTIAVSLDGKPEHTGELSEHRASVENVASGSQGGHTLPFENRFSRWEVNISEDRGTGWLEAAHDVGDLSDLGDHHREELPCGADGSILLTGANHGLERVLPNIDPVGSCLVAEASVLSIYGIPESSSERDLHGSHKLQRQCDGEPCFSGREPSALCVGQDSGVGGSGSVELNACNSADDKAGSVGFGSTGNDTESQSQQLSTMRVSRRRNPKRAASSRNLRSEKPDQINKGSSGSRRPKKVETTKPLYQSTTSTHPNKITRGRSGLNRQHKSSAWGSLEKLMDGFSHSSGPLTSNSHPTYQENARSGKRSTQMNLSNIQKCRRSRSSKNNCTTLPHTGHLTADTDASLKTHREVVPKVASYTSEFTDGSNTEHLKRDLACCTQEICAAEVHGGCAKISNSGPPLKNDNGNVMLPVGFSPDSVLEVASVTCESNAPASHDIILHENSPDAELKGCGHHSVVLPTSYLVRSQAPSLIPLEQQDKTAGVNENMEREQTNPSHAMMNNDADQADVRTLQESKTVRKNSVVRKRGSKKKDGTTEKNLSRSSTQISSFEASKPRTFSNDANLSDPCELLVHTGHSKLDSGFKVQTLAQDHGNTQSSSVTDNSKGSAFHSMRSQKQKKDGNAGKKGKVRDSHAKGKAKKLNLEGGTSLDRELLNFHSAPPATSHSKEQIKDSGIAPTDLPGNIVCKMDDASVPAAPPPRAAWVCCDDCHKWRCIPAELADAIGETNCRWTCNDNGDKAFANCSIPQEKSNAEINAELDISDVSADEADDFKAPSWTHVRLNLFLHRNRRTQSIDEIMVCSCTPPRDGRMGCRDSCLNRILNIECVKRTCPCGEQCSNQQFQRRNYAKLSWFYSGKKGYGLQLQEDVSEGRFLIEYVGEVLDIASYESRQRYYASKGQKHFYFMALNGGEVIDACTKGNLGRFINHSCSPNCRTEKWMVNGEVCIGIFATRNIKKGEELTFDYNYVRVSGAAPQKCFCGTAKCRGYIGGDISIVDTIDQDETEAEHFEHTVVHKVSEELMGANGSDSRGTHPDVTDPEFSIQDEDLHDLPAANAELKPLKQIGGTLFDTIECENSLDAWCPQEDEDVIRTPVHVSRTTESSLQHFPVHGVQSSDSLRQTPCATEILKAPKVLNGSAPGSDLGGSLVSGSNANKRINLKHRRNVKQSSPIDNEHILGVEGRLNNLLDKDGGISKRKDATNGYLKLLFLTAAEGDSSSGISKSVRDLSLILDALLKTKSRAVLLDIIDKNGLQMLHNILKQNRSNFHRIPIIRKLLKVLEFLALKEILTPEHINGGPRCAGVESFRDSMLSLTRHNDIQVHQIARNFRDRWIPRNTARSEPTEYPRASTFAQDFRGNNMAWNSARRKRKSRWDYQPDEHYKMVGLKFQKASFEHGSSDVIGLMGNKMQGHHGIVNSIESTDDVPPGFEPVQERRPVQALDCEVAPGLCMERYQPSLTISYGIPIALVCHIGTPEAEGQCQQKWKVAPGVPFNPFPPLPPYPRGSPCPPTSSQISQHIGSHNMKHDSYGRTMDRDRRVHRTWRDGPRTRLPYSNHGKKFPSNHHRFERFQTSRPQ